MPQSESKINSGFHDAVCDRPSFFTPYKFAIEGVDQLCDVLSNITSLVPLVGYMFQSWTTGIPLKLLKAATSMLGHPLTSVFSLPLFALAITSMLAEYVINVISIATNIMATFFVNFASAASCALRTLSDFACKQANVSMKVLNEFSSKIWQILSGNKSNDINENANNINNNLVSGNNYGM